MNGQVWLDTYNVPQLEAKPHTSYENMWQWFNAWMLENAVFTNKAMEDYATVQGSVKTIYTTFKDSQLMMQRFSDSRSRYAIVDYKHVLS